MILLSILVRASFCSGVCISTSLVPFPISVQNSLEAPQLCCLWFSCLSCSSRHPGGLSTLRCLLSLNLPISYSEASTHLSGHTAKTLERLRQKANEIKTNIFLGLCEQIEKTVSTESIMNFRFSLQYIFFLSSRFRIQQKT